MKVTFVKTGARRYAVEVSRDRDPDLRCGSIGYDEWLPHDALHCVFGDLAAAGRATTPSGA